MTAPTTSTPFFDGVPSDGKSAAPLWLMEKSSELSMAARAAARLDGSPGRAGVSPRQTANRSAEETRKG